MKLEYVLITAAHNEEAFIEKTIRSVIAQTIMPKKWIIISDGSTDRTDEIVNVYAKGRDWMELIRMPEHKQRNYAAKANCVNTGYEKINNIRFDLIANLDADISFEENFFEFLLQKFEQISNLGVAGTLYVDDGCIPVYSLKDVAGQCQVFRRECFEEIGGYVPSKYGGIDNIAVLTARMKGWETRTFSERTFFHHRPMSTAGRNKWTAKIKHGREDYLLGNHPLWELFRVSYQMTKKPYVIGGVLLAYGYLKAVISRLERPVSQELIKFYRKEQILRLKTICRNLRNFEVRIEEA